VKLEQLLSAQEYPSFQLYVTTIETQGWRHDDGAARQKALLPKRETLQGFAMQAAATIKFILSSGQGPGPWFLFH
jgi:hypothetical protein